MRQPRLCLSLQSQYVFPHKQKMIVCHKNWFQPSSLNQILDVLPGAVQEGCRSQGVNDIFLNAAS